MASVFDASADPTSKVVFSLVGLEAQRATLYISYADMASKF
jgi:hypothetical protein